MGFWSWIEWNFDQFFIRSDYVRVILLQLLQHILNRDLCRRSSVDLPVSKMNHFIVQQNTFLSCEETRGFASISDLKDPVVCPKPRRLAILANNHIKQPLRWHQTEVCDSKAGADLLDIILKKASSYFPYGVSCH